MAGFGVTLGTMGTVQCCLNTMTKVVFISVSAIQVWGKGWDLWIPALLAFSISPLCRNLFRSGL